MENVLLVVDGGTDERVFERARRLARVGVRSLALLSVVEPPAELPRLAREARLDPDRMIADLVAERRAAVEAALAQADLAATVTVDIVAGKAFMEIIRFVVAHDIDVVVKAAERPVSRVRRLIGSTDQHLIRKCPCRLWLVRGSGGGGPIVAAVDVDEAVASEPATLHGLNERILKTAVMAAATDGVDVRLLHVWDAPAESLLRMWAETSDDDREVRGYLDSIKHALGDALDGLAARASTEAAALDADMRVDSMLVRGEPREVIPDAVASLDAGVLVLGTVARIGIAGFIIGNTAEDVLNAVECDLLAVKPEGFVTPLALSG